MKKISLKNLLNEVLTEYTPSDPKAIDDAIADIERLGVRSPLNPKDIVIDNKVSVEVASFDNRLWLSSILSIDKGEGNATKVMNAICKIADKHNVTIALDPAPFGKKDPKKLNYKQLVSFYKKFGFKFEEGEEGFGDMERVPNQKS